MTDPTDGEIILRLTCDTPANPKQQWLRALQYKIIVADSEETIGHIDLRIGNTKNVLLYGGHLGFSIEPKWQGHHYAGKACNLVKPIAKTHGMDVLWITCNPDNWPSRRTCEWVGASLVEIVDLPPENDQYLRGERRKCRYRWTI